MAGYNRISKCCGPWLETHNRGCEGVWRDYASMGKRKTDGGSTSSPHLTPVDKRILSILGPETLEGIPGA